MFIRTATPQDAAAVLAIYAPIEHESVGFTPVGVYPNIGIKFGVWCDVGWWQCDLLPAAARMGEPAEPRAFAGGVV